MKRSSCSPDQRENNTIAEAALKEGQSTDITVFQITISTSLKMTEAINVWFWLLQKDVLTKREP
jgi:hypothetical protein